MGSDAPLVVYDASVLFGFQTAHVLTFMAQSRVVRAKWTKDIQAEWVERSLEKYPGLKRSSIEARRDAMNRAVEDAMVVGYEKHIPAIDFPDPNDRHVVAAAIECGARGIVTRDKAHFNQASLAPFGLSEIDPDDLLCRRLEEEEDLVREIVEAARRALTKTRPDLEQYVALLRKGGLGNFADKLEDISPKPPL